MNRITFPVAVTGLSVLMMGTAGQMTKAQEKAAPDSGVIIIQSGVAISGVARGGRVPFAEDAVQSLRVRGAWQPPKNGDVVTMPDGSTHTWETISADADGVFTGRALSGGGYFSALIESPTEQTLLLEASGNGTVYVNGEPRAGDPYSYGYLRLPVRLRKGSNHLLFSTGRGRLKAHLLPVSAPLVWNTDDATLPDLRSGNDSTERVLWAALPLINTTGQTLTGLTVTASVDGGVTVSTPLPSIPPMTVCKVGFRLEQPTLLAGEKATLKVQVAERDKSKIATAETSVSLRIRQPEQTFKQTFRSGIDGSVQYFGVNPALKPSPSNAFILSLHGASVEAIGQADAYSSKDWATLVAPTNRRPFGFDWEDWGRLDALEVFSLAEKQFPHDPARVFLTGHSMGGHGTWSVGSLFPDRFAVIGPSAGWISFATYASAPRPGGTATAGTPATPNAAVTSLVQRAANQHDTLAWSTNLLQEWVYIIHGDADDNVPVTEARQMRTQLAAMNHPHVDWHEEKGAGHWWDDPKTPGAECVDWRPLFALFETERLRPQEWNEVNFTTVNPAISGANRWIRIEQQEKSLVPSSVNVAWNATSGTVTGTTKNVATLTIVASRLPGDTSLRSLVLDQQALPVGKQRGASGTRAVANVTLRRVADTWQVVPAGQILLSEKTPERGGPFKQAFQNRFLLVYGTEGTTEEKRWSLARARFDAESFLYRGNGSPEVIADRDYKAQTMRDQSVILYGNADTNRLWNRLLKNSPIQVQRGKVRVQSNSGNSSQEVMGDNLACLFLRPKPESDTALVGVVSGTGSEGFRLTECCPYFTSGAAFPDWAIIDSGVLTDRRRGVVGAGYFGNDWGLASGEFAWRNAAGAKTVVR